MNPQSPRRAQLQQQLDNTHQALAAAMDDVEAENERFEKLVHAVTTARERARARGVSGACGRARRRPRRFGERGRGGETRLVSSSAGLLL